MAVPDYIGAMIVHLRAQSEITALCPIDRIKGRLPLGTEMPGYFITVTDVPAGNHDQDTPFLRVMQDIRCYGPTPLNAKQLWGIMHPYLEPPDRASMGFTAANCRVTDVRLILSPGPIDQARTDWPGVMARYRLRVLEVAVA